MPDIKLSTANTFREAIPASSASRIDVWLAVLLRPNCTVLAAHILLAAVTCNRPGLNAHAHADLRGCELASPNGFDLCTQILLDSSQECVVVIQPL